MPLSDIIGRVGAVLSRNYAQKRHYEEVYSAMHHMGVHVNDNNTAFAQQVSADTAQAYFNHPTRATERSMDRAALAAHRREMIESIHIRGYSRRYAGKFW